MACLWLSGPLIIPLLILSPPVPQLFPTLSRVKKTDSRSQSEPPQHSPSSLCIPSPHTSHIYIFSDHRTVIFPSEGEQWWGPYVTLWCWLFCWSWLFIFYFFNCSSFESAYVYAVLNNEENWSREQLRQIRSSLLHFYSASLAFSTGRPPYHFSFAFLSSGMFLLCLHESKAVSGLFLSLLSPGCISFALHTSFLVESLKHCILRKKFLCKCCNFYNWLSSLEFFSSGSPFLSSLLN